MPFGNARNRLSQCPSASANCSMTARYLVDEDLPRSLVRELRLAGIEILPNRRYQPPESSILAKASQISITASRAAGTIPPIA